MTLRERVEAIQKLEIVDRKDLPYDIICAFPQLIVSGTGVSFAQDGDYLDLERLQIVTAWMVEQFGLPASAEVADKRRKKKQRGK